MTLLHMLKNGFIFFIDKIKSFFFSGLIALLPLALTLSLFLFVLNALMGWLKPLKNTLPHFVSHVPFSEVILIACFIIATGILVQILVMKPLIALLESLVKKIPLISTVYGGFKKLIDAFSGETESFKHAVLVEFPRHGVYSIGFLSSKFPEAVKSNDPDKAPEELYNVFVPKVPNPTVGFLILVPANQIHRINLTRQEAMALIISGGIIAPER